MRKPLLWLSSICIIGNLSDRPIPGYRSKALYDAKEVGFALKLHAGDHGGQLPEALQLLIPDYLPVAGANLLWHMTLTVPKAHLDDLSSTTIIAWKLMPEDGTESLRFTRISSC